MSSHNNQQDKKWLIRSNMEILGPYTKKEVEKYIRTQILNGYDEICESFGRYSYIRLNSNFIDVLEEISEKTHSLDNDTKTVDLHSQTLTETGVVDVRDFDKTDPEIFLQESEEVVVTKPEVHKHFGSAVDMKIESRVLSYQKFSWSIVAICIVIGVFFSIKKFFIDSKTGLNFEQLTNKGLKAYQLGDYEWAWNFLSQADIMRPNQSEVLVKLASLRMSLKGERVSARRVLESLLASKQGRQFAPEIYTNLAVFYMKSENWLQAEKHLEKALQFNSNFLSAILNQAKLAFYQKRWQELQRISKIAIEIGGTSRLSYFISGLGYLREYESSVGKDGRLQLLLNAEESLKFVTDRLGSYRSLAFLLRAYIESIRKSNTVQESLRRFINSLGDEPHYYYRDLLVHNSEVKWEDFFRECVAVSRGLYRESWRKSFYGLCLILSQREQEAVKFINEATLMTPKDALVQTIRTFYLRRMGQDGEAKSSAKLAQREKKYSLPFLIEGLICFERENLLCAKESWEKALKIEEGLLPAYMGLLRIAGKDQNLVHKIEQFYPNYLPLYRYREGKFF